jgi:catechol 2,3-dioxygenase-like lactoylglutathione lyase family enzyme
MRKKVSTMMILQFVAGTVLLSAAVSQAVEAQSGDAPAGVVTGLTAGQITFSVENLDLETNWYVRTLGFKVARTGTPRPDFTVRTLTIPGFAIDLVKQNGSTVAAWPYSRYMQQGYVHFAFYTSDVTGALKALQGANADVTPLKGDNGAINRLIVHDPEGNELELFIPPKY